MKKTLRQSIQSWCYPFCVMVWTVCSVLLGKTTMGGVVGLPAQMLYTLGRYGVYAILAVYIAFFNRPEKPAQFWAAAILTLIVGFSALASGEIVLASVLLFVLGARNSSPEQIVKAYFYTHLCLTIATVFMVIMGLIDPNVMYRGRLARMTFGFSHPNAFGTEILVLTMCYLYLRWETLTLNEIGIGYVIALVVYVASNCRTAFVLMILLLTATLFLKRFGEEKLSRYYALIAYGLLGIVLVVGLVFAAVYAENSALFSWLDRMLSYRLTCLYGAADKMGVSLFGTPLVDGVMLDNSFMRVFFVNGLLAYLALVSGCILCTHSVLKTGNTPLLLAWCGIIFLSFMENFLFRMEYNWVFSVMGCLLLSGENRQENLRQWVSRMLRRRNRHG